VLQEEVKRIPAFRNMMNESEEVKDKV